MFNKNEVTVSTIVSPKELKKCLDEYTIGKDEAKKVIALAISEHIKRTWFDLNIKKTNVLLLGATGCGKSHIVNATKLLLDNLEIPCMIIDAQKFSEKQFLDKYSQNVKGSIPPERGVVILENIDRITLNAKTSKKSLYKNSIQNEIAQVIEGKEIKNGNLVMNTKDILFIATGTFDNVDLKIKERQDTTLYDVLGVEDLKEFGLNNFLMRKFQKVIAMPRLSKEDIISILKQKDINPVASYVKNLAADGVEFEIEEEAMPLIAERSITKGIGVSGIYITLTNLLTDYYFNVEDIETVKKCIITKETLENGKVKIVRK